MRRKYVLKFFQDVDEDHIKNTSCTDPIDHQEHPIHQVFQSIRLISCNIHKVNFSVIFEAGTVKNGFELEMSGEPGPHVLPSGATHDALVFFLLFLGANSSILCPYMGKISPLCPYLDQICPFARPPLDPQCGQL